MAKYYITGYMTNNSQRISVSATVESDSEFVAIELAKSKFDKVNLITKIGLLKFFP